MRILVDAQPLHTESSFRGIGRYTSSLLRALLKVNTTHEIILVFCDGLEEDTIKGMEKCHRIHFKIPLPVKAMKKGNLWRRATAELLRESFFSSFNPDVILVTSLFEGYIDDVVVTIKAYYNNPTAVILYDFIPLLYEDQYFGDALYKDFYLKRFEELKKADLLLAISEETLEDALKLGFEEARIVNIGAACPEIFKPALLPEERKEEFLKHYGIKNGYILYVGGFDGRKNVQTLLRAFSLLPTSFRSRYSLVFAGKISPMERSYLESLANTLGVLQNLIFTNYVSDNHLLLLYSHCEVFVFPSLKEGFGLPLLEALACHAPVLASRTVASSFLLKKEDFLFDPLNADELSRKMKLLLEDEELKKEAKKYSATLSSTLSWEASAKVALSAIERSFSEKKRVGSSWADFVTNSKKDYSNVLNLISHFSETYEMYPSEEDLFKVASAVAHNQIVVEDFFRKGELPERLTWRIEGPFDSSYSLALINRETARALDVLGHYVILHSTEGPGDFSPNPEFLEKNPDLKEFHRRATEILSTEAHVTSRILYPPRVEDMECRINLLHHYAWEESGFPIEWAEKFNDYLQGMTCLSKHVAKIMIDHGVKIPISVTGCGVDHFERIEPDPEFRIEARSFRFLHVSSCFPRKGVDVLFRAYGRAFKGSDDVSLIVKTFPNPHNEVNKWLEEARRERDNFPHVLIINEDLSDSELKALYHQCHVLVAPSRAEGFGLPIAEAMLSGLPVITTRWSGQLEFCDEETAFLVDYKFRYAETHFNLFDSVWAEPDEDELAAIMRKVFELPRWELKKRAEKGRGLLLEKFCWKDVTQRLVDFARSVSKTRDSRKPRIGWISTWNVRCGIAMYSYHLTRNFPENPVIFAPKADSVLEEDLEKNVFRCFRMDDKDDLDELSDAIEEAQIDALIVQFNYGFFNLEALNRFLLKQVSSGRIVAITLHSTHDPIHIPEKKLLKLKESLSSVHRILVHSVNDLNRLKDLGIIDNVTIFPQGIPDFRAKNISREKRDFIELASYGFFLPHKGLLELIEAIHILLKKGFKIHLNMVNARYPIRESDDLIEEAKEKIKKLGLSDHVHLITDFLPDSECLSILSRSDLIVFPYKETGESSSAAVHHALASGAPVAVTPLPIFDDISKIVFYLSDSTPSGIAESVKTILKEMESPSFHKKMKSLEEWRKSHYFSVLGMRLCNMMEALWKNQRIYL